MLLAMIMPNLFKGGLDKFLIGRKK